MGLAQHLFHPEAARRWIVLDIARLRNQSNLAKALFTCVVCTNHSYTAPLGEKFYDAIQMYRMPNCQRKRPRHILYFFNPFTPKSDQVQIPPTCSLARNMTLHSRENLAFHRFTQMKEDYTTKSHYRTHIFPFERLGECTFWTWEWEG